MTDGVPLPEGFPPYIHTRHLSAADQAYCEENPTYAGRLQSLQELRVEMQHAQEVLAVGKRHRQKSKKQLEAWEHESRSIEDAFMKADDELAMLAECLLSWPVVWRHDEEVRFSQGRWMWPLPSNRVLERHQDHRTSFRRPSAEPKPARQLSRRLSTRLARFLPGGGGTQKRLKKARSVQNF